jgi:hypothetical protein
MKQILPLLVLVVLLTQCKEVPPFINYDEDSTTQLRDTTYVLSQGQLPAVQNKNAVIEDFSGVRCNNCPEANERANTIRGDNPGDVFVITIHPLTPKNLTFPYPDDLDLRTEEGEQINQLVYPAPGTLPYGGVNRVKDQGNNSIVLLSAAWQSKVADEISKTSPVWLQSEILETDTATRLVTMSYTVTAMEDVTDPPRLSLMLLEDDLITTQLNDTGKIKKYKHKHVLREMLTSFNGDPVFESFELGRTYEREIVFEVPEEIVLANTSVLLFINRNEADDKSILQAEELRLIE